MAGDTGDYRSETWRDVKVRRIVSEDRRRGRSTDPTESYIRVMVYIGVWLHTGRSADSPDPELLSGRKLDDRILQWWTLSNINCENQ